MQKRRWIALIAALLALAALAGCAPTPAPVKTPPAPPATSQAAVQYPLSVVDSLGRTVTLSQQPQRILSLAPSNTEILFALGLGDKVVGTDTFSDYPEEAKAKEKVGGLIDPNPEKMLALKPDVAFAIGGSEQQYAKLLEQNVPVVVLQPKNLEQVYETIRLAGRVTGVPDKADAVIKQMQDRIAAVTAKTQGLTDAQRPKVFYEVYHDPLMTVGPGSFIHDLIGLAGGRNIAEQVGKDYAEVSPELLVQQNPDLILSPYADFLTSVKDGKYPAWSGVTAVKEKRLFQVDDNMMSRSGPRLADALEQMARIIHPELFQ
ncbi:MAG: ABC transporter substrate-binding protein [Bacillota bacterium]